MDLNIDELAELGDVSSRTIRHYVANGCLPPARSGEKYDDEHFERLEAIKDLQSQGLPLHDIRERLTGDPALGVNAVNSSHVRAGTRPLPETTLARPITGSPPKQPPGTEVDGLSPALSHRGPDVAWGSLKQSLLSRALIVTFSAVAAVALVVSAFALVRANRGEAQTPPYAMPEACGVFSAYAVNVSQLAGNVLGPNPGLKLTHDQIEELLRTVDEALTLRDKACVRG